MEMIIRYEAKPLFFSTARSNASGETHYDNTPIQYTVIFHGCKKYYFLMKNCDIFLIFAQNIGRGYIEDPPQTVLTRTHNLCFRAKIRKHVYHCKPQFYYIKRGCKVVLTHGHVILMVFVKD